MRIILLVILTLVAQPLIISQAQQQGETESEEAIEQSPVVIEEPAYEYFYWPEEDLNNFGLSTMGEGKSGSTLGTSIGRTSNIEANEYLRSKKEARNKTAAEEGEETKSQETKAQDEPFYEAPQPASSKAPSDNPIYEWRDEDGNLHMTNDLGQVPTEYQDQFFQGQSEVPKP